MDPIRSRSSAFAARSRALLSISIPTLVLIPLAVNVSPQSVIKQEPQTSSVSSGTSSSATRLENSPPYPPAFPDPQNGTSGVPLARYIAWQTYEPDGDAMTYDIYEGTDPNPPLIQAGHTWCCGGFGAFNQPVPLPSSSVIYWRVVAKDPYGGEASSPVWSYTTRPNTPPIAPHTPVPPDNAPTFSSSTVDLTWESGDVDHHLPVYDVYFGTDPTPPLVASNVTTPPYPFGWSSTSASYPAGPFANGITYYWRIVARDTEGAEISSPVWMFTAGENEPPVFSDPVTPAEGATAGVVASLSWSVNDPNLDPMVYALYLGPTNPPALFAENLTMPSLQDCSPFCNLPALLTGTTYYWYVVASDGVLESTSPTHSFTTVPPGDVTRDGQITVFDATCALNLTVWATACTGVTAEGLAEARGRADVNCDNALTPADARCIHKSVIDGSCTICSGGTTPAQVVRTLDPVVGYEAWIDYDTLKVLLNVSNLPSLKSFELSIESYEPFLDLTRVFRRGATSSFQPLNSSGPIGVGTYPYSSYKILLAGYTLGDIDCTSETDFLELQFYLPDHTFSWLKINEFVDDLAGAPEITILGNQVPVLFSAFTAVPRGGGVDVAWELQSGEAMESYTLYRRDGGDASPRAITQGPVTTTTGSYFDDSVLPGRTYQYELEIKTTDGDVFRSPIAKATTTAAKLALHQNVPNPFNPQTSIRYDLPSSARVRLTIVDVAGRRVRTLVDEQQTPGSREAIWTGRDDMGNSVASGVYFSVLDVGKERLTRKLVLLK